MYLKHNVRNLQSQLCYSKNGYTKPVPTDRRSLLYFNNTLISDYKRLNISYFIH